MIFSWPKCVSLVNQITLSPIRNKPTIPAVHSILLIRVRYQNPGILPTPRTIYPLIFIKNELRHYSLPVVSPPSPSSRSPSPHRTPSAPEHTDSPPSPPTPSSPPSP